MYEPKPEFLPRSWINTEQTDSRIASKRLAEYGTETEPVRVSGTRTCPGGPVDPRWELSLKTEIAGLSTTDRFDTAGCREDADTRLWGAMERINRVLDRVGDGYVSHKRMIAALDSRPSVRLG